MSTTRLRRGTVSVTRRRTFSRSVWPFSRARIPIVRSRLKPAAVGVETLMNHVRPTTSSRHRCV